jgi:hypothetical protein
LHQGSVQFKDDRDGMRARRLAERLCEFPESGEMQPNAAWIARRRAEVYAHASWNGKK